MTLVKAISFLICKTVMRKVPTAMHAVTPAVPGPFTVTVSVKACHMGRLKTGFSWYCPGLGGPWDRERKPSF